MDEPQFVVPSPLSLCSLRIAELKILHSILPSKITPLKLEEFTRRKLFIHNHCSVSLICFPLSPKHPLAVLRPHCPITHNNLETSKANLPLQVRVQHLFSRVIIRCSPCFDNNSCTELNDCHHICQCKLTNMYRW